MKTIEFIKFPLIIGEQYRHKKTDRLYTLRACDLGNDKIYLVYSGSDWHASLARFEEQFEPAAMRGAIYMRGGWTFELLDIIDAVQLKCRETNQVFQEGRKPFLADFRKIEDE